MKRDKDALSDDELFKKTTSIVEHAVNSKISITNKRGENYCSYEGTDSENTKLYTINISKPPVKCIDMYTALLHELGHVLYKSPFTPVKKMLEKSDHRLLYRGIINVLEDERIESHLSENYIAYRQRFEKTCRGLGKNLEVQNNIDNPLYILLAIRFKQENLVMNSKNFAHYKKALDDVKITDKFGALRVFISIKKYIEEVVEPDSNYTQNTRSENQKKIINSISNPHGSTSLKGESKYRKEFADSKDLPIDTQEVSKIISDHASSEDIPIPSEFLGEHFEELEINQILKEGKVLGRKQFLEIRKNILTSDNISDKLPSNVTKIKRKKQKYAIDYKVSSSLNKLFKQLKMRNKPFVDYQGYEIDIEEYVNNVIRGIDVNKSFENHKKSHGASIVLSIDASSSMKGNYIQIAQKLVATIYESLKEISNIEVKGNVWSGNLMGDVGITEINSIKDVENITVADNYGLTPTHMGLEYSGQMLKNMRGEKKMLILITDGVPNHYKNNTRILPIHYNKVCKKSLLQVLQITPNVLCIVVQNKTTQKFALQLDKSIANLSRMTPGLKSIQKSYSSEGREEFVKIFGAKRLIYVNDMDEAFFKVTKQFRKFLQKNSTNFF